MLTEKTFDTGTVSLNYVEGPPSGAPLVMLHGVTTWWQTFLPVLPTFLMRYHIYALDLRGHGRSERAPGAYSIRHDAEDIVAFLREQVREPAILLGWSLGAIAALVVAAEAPTLVRAVVLEDPPLSALTADDSSQAGFYERFSALRDVMMSDGSTADKQSALAAIMPPNADAANIRRRLKQLSQCDPEELTLIIERKKFAPYHLETLLTRLACPVLLLQGDPDLGGALTDQDAALATPLLADCTHVYLENVGHGIHSEQPVVFGRIVSDFLESL
ncbi:MAG: alpha/beta hydrolase [Candidatus Hydrogenedentes bacterium]|nr:alpha/beta hydrolase [Candidatus Hydrogenedentota bacterium]